MTTEERSQLQAVLEHVDSRFKAVDDFHAAMLQNFQALTGQVSTLQSSVDHLTIRVDVLDRKVDAINDRLASHDRRFEAIDVRFEAIEKHLRNGATSKRRSVMRPKTHRKKR